MCAFSLSFSSCLVHGLALHILFRFLCIRYLGLVGNKLHAFDWVRDRDGKGMERNGLGWEWGKCKELTWDGVIYDLVAVRLGVKEIASAVISGKNAMYP